MDDLFSLLFLVALVALLFWLAKWAITDALARGKSAWLVLIAVVIFFPWGLVAWLVFRPDRIGPNKRRPEFRLEDYRVR
jgi:hypothetical protein